MQVNKYINVKTGAIIETDCVIKGEKWEPLKTTKKNKKAKKVGSEEESGTEKEVSEEESGE